MGLEVAAHQQVELLVGAAHFHVGLEGHGVIALAEGIDEFVDGDGALLAEAFFKVVAFHHAGHGIAGGQTDEVRGVHLAQPVGVEFHDGLFGVEDLEDLLLVGLGIGDDLFLGQGGTGLGAAGGVADAAGEVTDQEDDLVAQFLKVAHLVHDHGVAQMQVGSGGVKAHLHAQGRAAFQFLAQFLLVNQFRHAALDHGHLAINIHHRTCPCVELARYGRYPGRIASAKRGCQCPAGEKDEKGRHAPGEGKAVLPGGREGCGQVVREGWRERGIGVPRCFSSVAGRARGEGGQPASVFGEGRGQAGTPRQAGRRARRGQKQGAPAGPDDARKGRDEGSDKGISSACPGTGMKKAPTVARRRLTLPAWKGQTGN